MRKAAPGADFDVIVIGGGINGLVCATLIAQARKRVILLEARDRLGGMCQTSEIAPGYRVSTVAHLAGPLDADVVKSLKLNKLGMQFSAKQIGAVALSSDGRHIILGDDLRHTSQSLLAHSAADAKAWATFETRMRKAAQLIQPWVHQSPHSSANEQGRSGFFGGRSGHKPVPPLDAELANKLDASIAELLDDHFSSTLLKGALAFDAIIGNALSPSMSGTAFLPLLKRAQDPQNALGVVHPLGGMSGLVGVLQKAGEATGVKIRTSAKAVQFLFENGRVVGVALENGEAVYAPFIVSSLEPKETFLRMGAEQYLPFGYKKQLYGYRNEGCVAKVNLAVNTMPSFKGLDKRHLKDRLLIAPSIDELERSYSAFEQGRFSSEIAMEITVPSVHDASLVRQGGHVMSINVAYIPRQLSSGSWDTARAELVSIVGAKLRQYAPELPEQVVAADVYTPQDLLELAGGAGCHWHGGDLSFDQLGVLRPAFNAQHQVTPVAGLYLCGAGTHPCGGVTGTNGRLAAETVLEQMGGAL